VQPAQALVELALSVTVIAMFLSAAVDLGLAFKTYQTLVNATAEASSYLVIRPVVNCGTINCDPIAPADAEARRRFQNEQGTTQRSAISTLDLNADGALDDASLVQNWVQIDEADNLQVTPSGATFAVGSSFDPTQTDSECRLRKARPQSTNSNINACYIVIRSRMSYKPFVLQTLLGDTMTIRAISVRQIN
jgi:Flp pilus assembly protein TadG